MTRLDGQERAVIRETYQTMLPGSVFMPPSASSLLRARSFPVLPRCPRFHKDLIQHIEFQTHLDIKNILVTVLTCTEPAESVDYDTDCERLKNAIDGIEEEETAIIQIVAGKTPQQIETLKAQYLHKNDIWLVARMENEYRDWERSIFSSPNFRALMVGLLRSLAE